MHAHAAQHDRIGRLQFIHRTIGKFWYKERQAPIDFVTAPIPAPWFRWGRAQHTRSRMCLKVQAGALHLLSHKVRCFFS